MDDTKSNAEAFHWGSIGEAKWRELAAAAGASELQLKYAVCRHGGASQSAAARMAGYKGDDDAIRVAGYTAQRSTAVQNLLELATVAAPQDAHLTDEEVDAKIARLVRSQDANVSLKAIALRDSRETAKAKTDEAAAEDPAVVWKRLVSLLPELDDTHCPRCKTEIPIVTCMTCGHQKPVAVCPHCRLEFATA